MLNYKIYLLNTHTTVCAYKIKIILKIFIKTEERGKQLEIP